MKSTDTPDISKNGYSIEYDEAKKTFNVLGYPKSAINGITMREYIWEFEQESDALAVINRLNGLYYDLMVEKSANATLLKRVGELEEAQKTTAIQFARYCEKRLRIPLGYDELWDKFVVIGGRDEGTEREQPSTLEAENVRLREALQNILDVQLLGEDDRVSKSYDNAVTLCQFIAEQALKTPQ